MANVYARVREDGVVMHLFSDMFEKPKETDFLLKSGEGEEYIHVFCEGGGGKISLYTYDNLFQYKIENGVMVKRGEEELEEERKEQLENPDYSKIPLELKNRLKEVGLLENACTSTSIREDFTFEDLIHKTEVTFFTNWIDTIHFPRPIGSGVLLPGSDPRFKTILYTTTGFLFNKHLFQTFVCHVFIPEEGQLDEAGKPYEMFSEWQILSNDKNISNPNFIINPNFQVRQRDMTEYVTNKADNGGRYYPDRWKCSRDYNDSGLRYNIKKDGLHAYFISGSGSHGKLEYKFDKDVSRFLSEKTITISGKIKSDNPQTKLQRFLLYHEGTVILNYLVKQRVTDEDGISSVSIRLPILTNSLRFAVTFSGETDTEIIFEYFKLELGMDATLFVPPDPTEELLKCMSYYQEEEIHYRPSKEGSNLLIPAQSTRKVPMREIPNIKIYSLTGTENKFSVANGLTDTKDIISEIYNNKVGYYPAIVVKDVPVNESKVAIFKSDAEL